MARNCYLKHDEATGVNLCRRNGILELRRGFALLARYVSPWAALRAFDEEVSRHKAGITPFQAARAFNRIFAPICERASIGDEADFGFDTGRSCVEKAYEETLKRVAEQMHVTPVWLAQAVEGYHHRETEVMYEL